MSNLTVIPVFSPAAFDAYWNVSFDISYGFDFDFDFDFGVDLDFDFSVAFDFDLGFDFDVDVDIDKNPTSSNSELHRGDYYVGADDAISMQMTAANRLRTQSEAL
ncbi:MAG: hypothetical protein ACYCU7_18625 [Acidimicrobiales bacterium]